MCFTGEWGQDQEVLSKNESTTELEWLPPYGHKDKAARILKKKSSIAKKPLFWHAFEQGKRTNIKTTRIKFKMRGTYQVFWCFFCIILNLLKIIF